MNLPETARLLKRALSLSAHDETVLSAAANLTLATGDGQRTIAIFEELVRLDPVNGEAWDNLGFGYMMFGRYADAIAAFRKSLELEPDAVFTHELLGEALLLSGDLDGALTEMQREPHDIMRRLGLSFVYAALGRREESQRLLEEVGREHPDFSSPVAVGYARLGKADEAFEWLDRALRERDGGVLEARVGPLFQPLRADPRWQPFCNGSACRTSRSRRWTSTSKSLGWQGRAVAAPRGRIRPCDTWFQPCSSSSPSFICCRCLGYSGSKRLAALYGFSFDEPNLAILMRHRAVLFGLLGLFLLVAAFRPEWQGIAFVGGFASVLSFLYLAWSVGGYNSQVGRVVAADILALVCLVVGAAACFSHGAEADPATPPQPIQTTRPRRPPRRKSCTFSAISSRQR